MLAVLSPAKATLLAVHFAAIADIDSFSRHSATHRSVLRPEILFRILLTHLPETVDPSKYTPLLQNIQLQHEGHHHLTQNDGDDNFEYEGIDSLSEERAARKAKKLHLLELFHPDTPNNTPHDPLTLFLFHRAYKIDSDAGLLAFVPDLLLPFVDHCDAIKTWLVSTIIPLARRNLDYYPKTNVNLLSISEFERLPETNSIDYLLSEIQAGDCIAHGSIGRDLRGLLGPWFQQPTRWPAQGNPENAPAWAHFLQWLVTQSVRSWRLSVQAIEEYNGPGDIDSGPISTFHPQAAQLDLLMGSYLRAAVASAYSIQDPSLEGLRGTWQILRRVWTLLDAGDLASVEAEAESLPELFGLDTILARGAQHATHLRNDLLHETNLITSPTQEAITLLRGVALSAFLLSQFGETCSIRRAGEMVLLQDPVEQKGELVKVVRLLSSRAPRDDDTYWSKARIHILWLHCWGRPSSSQGQSIGPFGMIPRQELEMELLKAMLANFRFNLARSIYEDAAEVPLNTEKIEEAVLTAAFHAFDNASNPNRTRGGLKKCDDILQTFPHSLPLSNPSVTRIRALLTATHGLSNYKLVLKQGEPFTPVVLRVHSDPISIIEKVLEQNPFAYTRVSEFIEMSKNFAIAGLLTGSKERKRSECSDAQEVATLLAEKRIVAMCIEAALREDDFETAYSYVMSRLGGPSVSASNISADGSHDKWSWSAALKAGQYVRSHKSSQPTHLGISSGNPEIRHLEQRLECLATALRIAPSSQLLEILKTFRRSEEQLDSAVAEEAAKEDAWDAVGDVRTAPGSFDQPDPGKMYPPRNMTASASARQAEEAPMSLFDLSRATARIASKNFTSLSGLQSGNRQAPITGATSPVETEQARVRKRDQLRDAATGTLVSGVGWLIGANVARGDGSS